ncbi:DEAD/DEAH box helicase family protein [Streptomyces rubiginosohelvolus]|uniref:DEAD/DEAH box helicase family protein n=1 Tax=Streptomyces sp. CB02130 TaxID=1703934 RepID=UPI000ACC493F|nr:SNF2-related protein [Streptomyces sp. CB02130]
MTGVEVEPTTAAIARHLYPDAEIITSGLEQIELADGAFDAVVGNVPYGRYKRFDKVHNKDLTLSIHDHFVLKSLYATRPGGIVALITSRYTLDAEKTEARERLYELGDLVGAVRLPAGAHGAAAGTDVVTDVLFLRRRVEGEEPGDRTWLTATKRALPGHESELAVNNFFDAHPEYVLGELRAGSREWGPEVTVVGRSDQTPADALAAAAAAIAVDAQAAGLLAAEDQRAEPVAVIVPGGTEDALGLDAEGNPTIVENGRPVPLDVHPDQREQLVKLIRLKHLTLALYEAEGDTLEPGETPQLARLRAELRVGWRDYRKSHPPLTKPRLHYKFTPPEAKARAAEEGLKEVPEGWKARTAFAWIDDDPDAALLFGLEEWDDRTRKGIEQKVLHARVLEPRTLPVRAATAEDAIALAMEYDGGRLEMTRVASLLGSDVETVAAQVADASLAYRDPEQGGPEEEVWEPAHRYLSGNVRTKLAAAQAAAGVDPTFLGNVAALERVQPTDLTPAEIKAKIGAPWVPVDVYDAFLAHLGFENASVVHAGGTVWEVRGAHHGDLARKEWGTGSRSTQDLFTALLRQTDSTIQVTHKDADGNTWVDREATDEAQEKAKLIAEAFDDWVWSDKPRAERLAGIYNQVFNNLVMPEYSGSALVLPGLIADWEMRGHQNAAIRRIVNEPTALLAHVVGAGKTATMAAGAMELRRTGLANKPALVVPNHMLKQWTREFRQLYPNAKILAIAASDLSVKRRAKFMARMAGGDWDAVIFTHDAFNRVPLRPDTMRDYLDQEMRSLRDQLDVAAEAGMGRNTVKQIEESIANAEAKLQKQIESLGDDNGVFLEDTGIDYLFLDEAHEYKNLRTVSAIPGAAIPGSAKATKLHMVLSWLRETNESDRVATLATGTPIANSVTEAYVLKRYLAPTLLAEMGLDAFDNWAATFGEVVSNLEPDPKGDGYKYKARFARFFNVPELMSGYRTFADVQMAEDLNLPTPPVRENEDGQRGETILIPPTPAQREFIKQLPRKPWVRKPGGVLKALGEGLRASVDLDLVDATDALRALGVDPNRIMSTDPDTGERFIDYTKVAEIADLAATDMRSVGGTKDMGSKVPYAAEKIMEIWHETKDIVYPVSDKDPSPQDLPGGLQLVFLDEGTPGSKAKHGTNLYADLREELVARGMPREAIRFIHEAGTDLKKEKLFADCRAGRVRVLIGSTQKMGTGTNIQDRAVALHHLSYPWRPADMAQRDGRIERRGNLNAPWIDNTPDDVRVLYYITERTFDEFRLTTLARKARFIGQIQRREFNLREIEDIGADALNLGMLAALSSGDPAILQLAEATAERSRLQGLARSWDRAQDNRAQDLKDIDGYVARAEHALTRMREAAPTRRPTAGDAFMMTVDDATYRSRDTAANALGARMAAIAKDQSVRPGQHVPLGTLGGQDFHAEIVYGASGGRQLRLRFPWGNVVPIGHRDDRAQWQASTVTPSNGRGAIQSLEHFLNHLDEDLEKLAASAATQSGRREEIIANLRPKEDNPYRIQARSKEREERALSKLVVANEKEQGLAERAERAASNNPDGQAEEEDEELTALREQIAKLRKAVEDEHRIQEQAAASARGETGQEPAPHSRAAASESAPAETAGTSTGEVAAGPSSTDPDQTAAGSQDQPRPEQPPADLGTEAASEPSREQQFQEALDELLSGTGAEPEESGAQDQDPAAVDDDPLLAQMIAHDMGALAGDGWTEVVRPFTSQREVAFEQEHVQVVYERWAATQTALPMLVDADEELADEDPGITNPAGLVASWAYRARLAAASAGPTGGRTVVEQYEGLARAARRADTHLAEQDTYASDGDRALLLQVANTADQYAQRLAATLDVLAQQAQERQETESPAETRMRELQVLESAMEYLRDQGSDFRMDRQNATITDREAAGTQLRDDLLRVMRELGELPAERQNLDPDFRVAYASIRGIVLYVGWHEPGTPRARAVLGFDQLPLLDRDSFTAAELEATPPTQLIDHLDGKLDLNTLEAVRDREREAIQDLLADGVQGQQVPAADGTPPVQSGEPTADAQRPEPKALGEDSGDVAVPEGYQAFTDDSVQLEPGDVVRESWRQYMEDRHLRYRTVTVIEGPDPRDGYYRCRHQLGGVTRMHPREIVAVPDDSRLLPGNTPKQQEPTAPASQEAPEGTPAAEAPPLQELFGALGDRVSLTHIGGPQPSDEPAAPAPAEAEQHTEPAPEIARIAAVLRYYEPLLKRHKLSGKDVVAYIDRPGVGYSYDPDNPLLDLVNEIGKVGERVGGTFRRSYNEWVTYEVGAQRAAQSEQLTNLNLDLLTLYSRQTEPLFEVDLETILAAPPGTVIDLPEETAPEQTPSAIVIHHDAEGTTVKGTRKDDQPVRNALKDQGFRWSRRQSMWYLRRDTPLDARADAVRGLRDFLDRIGTAYTAYYDGAPAPAPQNTQETAETPQETAPAPAPQNTQETAETPQETAPAPETAETSTETPSHPVGWTIAALLSQQQLKKLVSAYVVDSQPLRDDGQRTERVREWIAAHQQTPATARYASPSSDLPEALRGNGDVHLSSGRDGISLEQAGRTTVLPWEEIPAWIEAAAVHDEAARETKRSAKRRYGRLDREIHFRSDERSLAARQAMEDLDVALWETAPPSEDQLAAARERFGPQPQASSPIPTAESPAADSAETPVDPAGTPEADPAQAELDGNRQDSSPSPVEAPAETAEPEPEGDSADGQEEGDEAPADAAEGMVIVQTPEGPGRVVGTDGDLVLVSTQSGTRVYEGAEVQWPEGTTRPEDGDFAAKRRRNEADLAQASTSEGIELNYGDGNRLVDLDAEAGHGTVVDADGAVVGWVRARLGDDGRRYWWGQDADGGPPDSMPFHEALPPSAGVPAIRAAGHVRTALTAVKEPAHRRPIPAEYASREVRLTTAQVRELRRLTLDSTYADGTPVEPPEWVAGHRKYQLNVAQMQALGEAAEAAAEAFPGVTAEERRTAKVLRNAAERFEFEVYDTARWRATIPPISERDPYAGPFQPRPRAEASEDNQTSPETAPVVAQSAEPAPTQNSEPEPTAAEEATAAEPDLMAAAETQAAADEESQLGLFPNETPDTPAPHRPARRRGTKKTEPATAPGTEGAEAGRLGVHGHADHGECERCERCGTADTDRYTVVWHWFAPDQGEMAAECAPCVELTTGLSRTEITRHADAAEAQRGGLRVQPRPLHQDEDRTTIRRTADNEWTAVHLPTGMRFRSAREAESGYRGYVTRDLNGVSHGVGPGVSTDVALRAALGRTAETHPNSGDDWVFFSYREAVKKVLLHDGESLVSRTNGPRTGGPYEHGPRWDLTIAGSAYVVEMVYQQGQPGSDGHRLEVTGPDRSSTRHVQWDGALEWAREHARGADTAPANARTASPPTETEQTSTESNDQVARSSWGLVDGERIRYTGQWDGRYELTLPGTSYLLFMPSVEYRRTKYAVSLNDQDLGITPKRLRRFTDPDEIIPWVRAHASKQQTGYVFRNGAWVEVPPVEQGTLPDGESAADDMQAAQAEPILTPPASAPDPVAEATPASDIEPVNDPSDEAVRPQAAPVPAREPDGTPGQEDTVAGEPDLAPNAAAPEPVGESPALDVEDPPAPQTYTEVFPLPLDAGYQLHLTGLDGQGFSEGQLKIGESTIAAVRLSASGRWFARLTADGLTADVTMLNDSPQEAAAQAAIMFAAVTGTPYGARPGPAVDYGPLTRVDVLRGEMKSAALGHLGAITNAAARVHPDYTQIPQFQDLSARLNALAAADADAHHSRQMTANLDAVQGAANTWGGSLPADPALDERQHLAFPLAHLLHDVTRLHARLQATLDAATAERAAAAAALAEPLGEEQAEQAPTPAAPHRVRGPVAVLGLREAAEGRLVAMVNTVEASQTLVLPGVTSADVPGMPLPVRVEVPMLVRHAQQAEHLVSDEETHAWLAGHLSDGPLAQAWSADAVRQAMVAVATDVLRDGMAPSVEEVAAWLVATAPERDGLLQAAHAATSVADFAPAFARAADDLVADGGSEFLIWRYLGDSEGNRRLDVLARATPEAYEQLRVLPAPAESPAPETATIRETELTAPITAETLEEPDMATPARDDELQEAQGSVDSAPQSGPVISIHLRKGGGEALIARVVTPDATRTTTIQPRPLRREPMPELPLPMTVEVPMLVRSEMQSDSLVSTLETNPWLARHLAGGPMESAWEVGEVSSALGDLTRDVLREGTAPTSEQIADWLANAATEDGDLLHAAHKNSLDDFSQRYFPRAANLLITNSDWAQLRWAYSERTLLQRNELLALAAPAAYERLRATEPPASAEAVSPDVQDAAAREEPATAAPSPDNPPPHTVEANEADQVPESVSADTGADTETGERQPETGEVADSVAPVEPAPVAEVTGGLPLFTGPTLDWGDGSGWQEGPLDLVSDFDPVKAAWDEHVPAENGSGEDLFADVQEELVVLQQLLRKAVADVKPEPEAPPVIPAQPAPAAEPAPVAAPPSVEQEPVPVPVDRDPQKAADAVNVALGEADVHAPALQDLPEWQDLQTVRGAFGNLVSVIKARAGEHLGKLMEDGRVADFLRRTSLRVCERVAGWAQAGADRLRRDGERGQEQRAALPSADALLRLGDAALAYRSPRGGGSTPPPASDVTDVNKVEALRRMGDALVRPMPGAGKRVSAAAARGRSTTTVNRPLPSAAKMKPANDSSDQAGHLRRNGDQKSAAKPNRRR